MEESGCRGRLWDSAAWRGINYSTVSAAVFIAGLGTLYYLRGGSCICPGSDALRRLWDCHREVLLHPVFPWGASQHSWQRAGWWTRDMHAVGRESVCTSHEWKMVGWGGVRRGKTNIYAVSSTARNPTREARKSSLQGTSLSCSLSESEESMTITVIWKSWVSVNLTNPRGSPTGSGPWIMPHRGDTRPVPCVGLVL